MGHRLTRIYTRTGDDGTTGLGDGSRIPKYSLRMEAIGTVDELNCHIGLLQSLSGQASHSPSLQSIQHDLFDLGGELSLPGQCLVNAARVDALESGLDAMNTELPPLKNFVLPGGNAVASQCHLARAVCRRAERLLAALSAEEQNINPASLAYINRLSDWLFVLARTLARANGGKEVLWQQQR